MKLFVWADPYPVRYGTSMVFAVAENVEEARLLAAKGRKWDFSQFEDKSWSPTDLTAALGEPARVVDLPCAEWHEWSE